MSGYICGTCLQPIRFVDEYQQWWCDSCQSYVSGAYSAAAPGTEVRFDSYGPPPAEAPPPPSPVEVATMEQQAAFAAYNDAVYAAALSEWQSQMQAGNFQWEALERPAEEGDEWEDEDDELPKAKRMPKGPARRALQKRYRELKVKGYSRDEIILIMRDGYTEDQVNDMRGSAQRPKGEKPGAGAAAQPTTIIVQGDYVGNKAESKVEVRDSVLQRASIGAGGAGGAGNENAEGRYKRAVVRALRNDGKIDEFERGFLNDIKETESIDDPTAARLEREAVAEMKRTPSAITGSCPGCRAQVQPGWKLCPACGAKLVP